MISERFDSALHYATLVHGGQTRKGTPRWPPKMYHLWPVENVPGVGGHLKVYHP